MQDLAIGCMADDFTGASDAASFLVSGGTHSLLLSGLPPKGVPAGFSGAVIALKTRSCAPASAINQSLHAAAALLCAGAKTIYFKYCSTFDSTPAGNIGPVLDELVRHMEVRYTVLCPALPVNGRTVRGGHLFVDGIPLHKTSMKDHPLNPMWDSDIAALMAPQSQYPCFVLTADDFMRPDREVLARVEELGRGHDHFYLIPDYFEDAHGRRLAELFSGLPLLSGGSGLLFHLGAQGQGTADVPSITGPSSGDSRAILLAGSCSAATRRQIRAHLDAGRPALFVDPSAILSGSVTAGSLWSFAERHADQGALFYSADDGGSRSLIQRVGQERVSSLIEGMMGELAQRAVSAGFGRIVVAGGETSGAVLSALGLADFGVGPSIAPGVPVLFSLERPGLRLALKSGNFGESDFFHQALAVMASSQGGR